jgi:uroporphyrinogen decarboxylase
MDLKRLKSESEDLGFFGGTLENETLSFSTPEDVRQQPGKTSPSWRQGGFLFAPIHNISQEVPAENILALYRAGREYGLYE